jgi:hypothetical protein
MRKFLIVLSLMLLAVTLTAQVRTGNIYGKITDAEGNPLPGVSVILKGAQMAPLTTVSGPTGLYRFVSLSPSSEYEITAELTGFKKTTKTGIIVPVASNVQIDLKMEVGTLEEQVTVIAVSPIIETKKTTVGQNLDKEALQSLPSARDPWVVLQLAPSIMVDRENVGGNESGQQSGFIAKGDTSGARVSGNQGANNIWAVDGIDVTDPAALGGSANYYDFDMFEELNVTTGGAADVTIQTGGVQLNMVTRRGGNRMTLAGRFYLTDNFFQSTNMTDALRAQGILDTNKIQAIKDFGFNAGGPIIKDKLWWWGAYGVQDIFTYTLPSRTGIGVTTPAAASKALLNNYNFKINAQVLANNRFEALVTSGAKESFGRNAGPEKPEGDHQTGKYHWGSPIVKLQDEHVFGNNFYLSLKYSFNDAGFGWRPIPDEAVKFPVMYDYTQGKYVAYASGMNASWDSYGVSRPRNNYQFQGTYFNDTFLGVSHEVKFGAEYSNKEQSTKSDGTGFIQGFQMWKNYKDPALDINLDGVTTGPEMAGWQRVSMYRRSGSASLATQWAAFIQDTMVKGNFTLSLGLRFDKQWSGQGAYTRDAILPGTPAWDTVFPAATSTALDAILPDVPVDAVSGLAQVVNGNDRPYQWNVFSPRIGLTWDISGDGKTVAKLALSQYGDIMGVGWYTATPYGTGGTMNYYWLDANADTKMDLTEMYWNYSSRAKWFTDPTRLPGDPARYVPYQVFNADGTLTPTAFAMLHDQPSIFDTDAYYSGNVSGFDWYNPVNVDYARGVTGYFANRASQNSARTREVLLTLEREILPDFSASINASYRKFDNHMAGYTYWPAEHASEYPGMWGAGVTPADIIFDPATARANGWYVEAGDIPENFYIGGTFTGSPAAGYTWAENNTYPVGDPRHGTQYSSGGAANRHYWLPSATYPTISSRYTLYETGTDYFTYTGVDLILNKRLSNKWMMNASLTWQNQKTYWNGQYFNPTNQWAFDGKAYGDVGGAASGKQNVLMYTRWMAKLSALYQLPFGFNVSGTFNAREGWSIPVYFTLYNRDSPNPTAGTGVTVYTQNQTDKKLPTFYDVSLRIEKKIAIGAGRMYLMADVFNLLNSNMPIRSYADNYGSASYRLAGATPTLQQYQSTYYNYTGLLNEVLNPRIWRFGVRFEF